MNNIKLNKLLDEQESSGQEEQEITEYLHSDFYLDCNNEEEFDVIRSVN